MPSPLERLKELQITALDSTQHIDRQAQAEERYADALRRVGPEILAVLEAVNEAELDARSEEFGALTQIPLGLSSAMAAFNARAAEVLGEGK